MILSFTKGRDKSNDYITLESCGDDDYWFHA